LIPLLVEHNCDVLRFRCGRTGKERGFLTQRAQRKSTEDAEEGKKEHRQECLCHRDWGTWKEKRS
jgi:hypothetical protein